MNPLVEKGGMRGGKTAQLFTYRGLMKANYKETKIIEVWITLFFVGVLYTCGVIKNDDVVYKGKGVRVGDSIFMCKYWRDRCRKNGQNM